MRIWGTVTPYQRSFLKELQASRFKELYVSPRNWRTVSCLVAAGFVEDLPHGWCRITQRGQDYLRFGMRAGVTVEERFFRKVNKTETCWLWTSTLDYNGYGEFHKDGETYYAHRVSWELHNGPIPKGLFVLHQCDNPPCVRPDHLFLGTQKDNLADMARKGRAVHKGVKGEDHPRAKVTRSIVEMIRGSSLSGVELARLFSLSTTNISAIRNHKIWRHI